MLAMPVVPSGPPTEMLKAMFVESKTTPKTEEFVETYIVLFFHSNIIRIQPSGRTETKAFKPVAAASRPSLTPSPSVSAFLGSVLKTFTSTPSLSPHRRNPGFPDMF